MAISTELAEALARAQRRATVTGPDRFLGILMDLVRSIIIPVRVALNNQFRDRKFLEKMIAPDGLLPVKGFMDFAARSKEGREPNEEALVERLRQFVENSDLSFYKIASRIGTSGGTLSMWLAGKPRPHAEELAEIEKFLKG